MREDYLDKVDIIVTNILVGMVLLFYGLPLFFAKFLDWKIDKYYEK